MNGAALPRSPHRGRGAELLAPADALKSLRFALAYGAHAVYAGLARYSLRVRNNYFDAAVLAEGIAAAHACRRHLYLACNLMPHGAKLRNFIDDPEPIWRSSATGPCASPTPGAVCSPGTSIIATPTVGAAPTPADGSTGSPRRAATSTRLRQDYLVALLRHAAAVALDLAAWMLWNYTAALARLAPEATDPAPA